ncbi:MgtC/SapB family protein [Rhizosaccharibacter radicis]|uniref:Protein MgtC n=1 Tax=Rhizosaccharibacter radicis TaxID=2782605 RepID=A0ABT1VTC5_9PROT|nr:MgtC/SapB family protein [Acetobacteraceae bacterium KSS12]
MDGQGLVQLGELALAFVLSALIGLEREFRHKSAGVRTYTLVGVAAALFMLISKYGFMNILVPSQVVLDPSRIAAQVVSGIGFIGGGVIFMRRDVVRGLTTAASVWLTAALGMACGAGLPVLAVATTLGHFTIMFVFPRLVRRLPRTRRLASDISLSYEDGRGLLRDILVTCTQARFTIDHVRIDKHPLADDENGGTVPERAQTGLVAMSMQVKGKKPVSDLITRLAAIDGVRSVDSAGAEDELE